MVIKNAYKFHFNNFQFDLRCLSAYYFDKIKLKNALFPKKERLRKVL